jgi:hypothetical protein
MHAENEAQGLRVGDGGKNWRWKTVKAMKKMYVACLVGSFVSAGVLL